MEVGLVPVVSVVVVVRVNVRQKRRDESRPVYEKIRFRIEKAVAVVAGPIWTEMKAAPFMAFGGEEECLRCCRQCIQRRLVVAVVGCWLLRGLSWVCLLQSGENPAASTSKIHEILAYISHHFSGSRSSVQQSGARCIVGVSRESRQGAGDCVHQQHTPNSDEDKLGSRSHIWQSGPLTERGIFSRLVHLPSYCSILLSTALHLADSSEPTI